MKIVNVTPGLIQIPPNGWGAVEKIIWEIHQNLLKLGHQSEIKYLDEVKPNQYDIVHIHVANLAVMAAERGIPYYFTIHDHHAYLHGRDSFIYKQNKEAIEKSVRSFVPAKYLVDFFENNPKLSYFSHGVNTDFFEPQINEGDEVRLLCVANNGYADNPTADRKGFQIAIDAAMELDMPLTIAGPINNKKWFDANFQTYYKLTTKFDLTEEELKQLYQNFDIFLHPSELEAGHPNLTLLEAMASGLPVVGTFEDNNSLKGMYKAERNKNQIVQGIKTVLNKYNSYRDDAIMQAQQLSWLNRTKDLLQIYDKKSKVGMKEKLIEIYTNTTKSYRKSIPPKNGFNFHFVDGAYFEVTGQVPAKYRAEFIDKQTNNVLYSVNLSTNCWAKTSLKYFVDYKVKVINLDDSEEFIYEIDLKNQRVFIALDSKSLGDTLAWFPQVDEFRKKHGCKMICSTFHNSLFQSSYPDIEFVNPGSTINNLYAMYTIGWFYKSDGEIDFDRNPNEFKNQPLQKTATDILGLDFNEVRPKYYVGSKPKRKKKVGIAIHSTTQAKYWNNPNGWNDVVKYLKNMNYEVVLLSKEGKEYMGNKAPENINVLPSGPIENVIKELESCHFFIGIGSGLSWLSWMTKTPTLIISGFSESYTETQLNTHFVNAPEGKCKGCFNTERLDAGDWNWCPHHKGTDRQFECSKSITSPQVILAIHKIMEEYPL
jgi:autotransporter strand-loop-strand O-heptosyltransferase